MRYVCLLLLLCLVGCGGTTPEERAKRQEEIQKSQQYILEKYIPKEATNIQHLGNRWVKFDLVIDEKNRTFLWHYIPNGRASTESLTEITN